MSSYALEKSNEKAVDYLSNEVGNKAAETNKSMLIFCSVIAIYWSILFLYGCM